MNYRCSFHNGIKLDLPDGRKINLGACEWHDDPLYRIEGNKLFRNESIIRELPEGTVVRLWDEEDGDPIIGNIASLSSLR